MSWKVVARIMLMQVRMTKTKTDMQLKHDIEKELEWDPQINAAQIGVSVHSGAVSPLGQVDTYAEPGVTEVVADLQTSTSV